MSLSPIIGVLRLNLVDLETKLLGTGIQPKLRNRRIGRYPRLQING
jgi:hypothetical protein